MVHNDSGGWRDRLERETQPPSELKRRVVGSLVNRGLLSRPGGAGAVRRAAFLAAALAVAFAGGAAVGRQVARRDTDERNRYALFFLEGPDFDQPPGRHRYMAEYQAWAATLRQGKMIEGHALDYPFTVLRSSSDSVAAWGDVSRQPVAIAGYIIIRAASDAEAVAIARTSPHLRHHGTIEIRRLVPRDLEG